MAPACPWRIISRAPRYFLTLLTPAPLPLPLAHSAEEVDGFAPGAPPGLEGCSDGCLNRLSYIHCDPKTCPCGPFCANRPFHLLKSPAMEIFLTENRWAGVQGSGRRGIARNRQAAPCAAAAAAGARACVRKGGKGQAAWRPHLQQLTVRRARTCACVIELIKTVPCLPRLLTATPPCHACCVAGATACGRCSPCRAASSWWSMRARWVGGAGARQQRQHATAPVW